MYHFQGVKKVNYFLIPVDKALFPSFLTRGKGLAVTNKFPHAAVRLYRVVIKKN